MSTFRPVDLTAVESTGDGVAWSASAEGLDANLVALGPGSGIGEHRNDEVDVLMVMLVGEVTVAVDGSAHALPAGAGGVVPRGSTRRIDAGPSGARYLSIHRARGPLGVRGKRDV